LPSGEGGDAAAAALSRSRLEHDISARQIGLPEPNIFLSAGDFSRKEPRLLNPIDAPTPRDQAIPNDSAEELQP
jgi:hypothetical protein